MCLNKWRNAVTTVKMKLASYPPLVCLLLFVNIWLVWHWWEVGLEAKHCVFHYIKLCWKFDRSACRFAVLARWLKIPETHRPPQRADLSLTTYRFWRLWSGRESPTQLLQWWREQVCRRRCANFRFWKWKPHFRGTNMGAMLAIVESGDARRRVNVISGLCLRYCHR